MGRRSVGGCRYPHGVTETPQPTRLHPLYVAVTVLFVVLVALALWATARGDVRAGEQGDEREAAADPAPSEDARIRADVERDLGTIEGVESATIQVFEEGMLENAPPPSPAVTIDLESFRTPEDTQATVDAVYGILAGSGLSGPPTVTVVDTLPGTKATLTLEPAGPGDPAVHDAVAFLDAGATSVHLTADNAAVSGRDPAALPGLAEVAGTLARPLNSLSTDGYGAMYTSSVDPVPPPLPAVQLLAEAGSRDETTQTVYEVRSPTGNPVPLLTVYVDGPPAPVADWLRASGQADLLGSAIAFTVYGSQTSESGFVSDRELVSTDPANDEADAAAAAADGVPPCTGQDLRAGVTGFDAAAGSRFLTVTAENVTDAPCALDGRPGLSFLRASGTVPDVLSEPEIPGQSPVRIVVPPGGVATSQLRWGAMSTANDPDQTTSVLVTTVPGADEARLRVADVPGAESGVDILEGARIVVGDWVRSSS
ncbi:hypothetical protein OERS_29170 [Oerskovia enterophila]|uniref:DUF4232 domain-containing protein n=1 Tax=Oerskovia enterophila TaxID=43678 RepID=A0ABX2Y2M0_9CELL|nr:hypothetical protein OERS_29170 [Oerskovia enterophila]